MDRSKQSLCVMLAAAGRPELLRRTLESIVLCSKPAQYAGTVVIENGPRCGLAEVVRGFSAEHKFRYLYSEQPNKCRALNLGLSLVGGGWVVFTDDDVRVRPDWLDVYGAVIDGVVGGKFFGGPVQIDAEHGLPPQWMRRYYPVALVEAWELPHGGGPTAVPGRTFMGPNWAAPVNAILAAGGFDVELGPGSERGVGDETEMQQRLEKHGLMPVYVPDAVVWHYLHEQYLAPAWVLKRTYRHGVAWGIGQTRGRQRALMPFVAGALRRLNAAAKGLVLSAMGGEERRFQAAHLAARWRGRWDGLWLGRNWRETRAGVSGVESKIEVGRARAA